jgi:hypothetical protein
MIDSVQAVIEFASDRGIDVDEFEAQAFLQAKRILERNPDDAIAREVVENFNTHLTTGKQVCSFSAFLLGEAP